MSIFDNYKNIDNTSSPDNRHLFCTIDTTDEVVIGGSSVHIFKLNFKASQYCRPANWFQITYKQSLCILFDLDIQSRIISITESENETVIKVALTPNYTKLFNRNRETFAQLKLYMKDDSVIYGDINKIKVIDTLQNEGKKSEDDDEYVEATMEDLIDLSGK